MATETENMKTTPTKTVKQPAHTAAKGAQFIDIFEHMKRLRLKHEMEWFLNERYYAGDQYIRYNMRQNKIEAVPAGTLKNKVTINRVYEKVTQAVAFLTKDEPRAQVIPFGGGDTEEAKQRVRLENKLLKYYYERLKLKELIKRVVWVGSKYSTGYLKVWWNPNKKVIVGPGKDEYTYGDIEADYVSPYRVYPDLEAKGWDVQRFLIHVEPRTINSLKAVDAYDQRLVDLISPDNKLTPSDYELRMMQNKYGATQLKPHDNDMGTKLVSEIYYWKWMSEKDKGGKEHLRKKLFVGTFTEDGAVLRDDDMEEAGELAEIPIVEFQWDITDQIFGEGMIKNLRPINRAINRLVSQSVEHSDLMLKGKWLMPRGAKVRQISDESGELIEYDQSAGARPEQVVTRGLPASHQATLEYCERKIDDVSKVHATFGGAAGFAGESATHAEIMQGGDANSFGATMDNLEDFIARVFKKILKLYIVHTKDGARKIRTADPNDNWDEIKSQDLNLDDDVTVRITSGFAYTKQYQVKELKELFAMKAVDQKTLLQAYEFDSIQDIMDATAAEQGNNAPNPDVAQAQAEDMAAMQGNMPLPLKGQNHKVHILIHGQFLKSPNVTNDQKLKEIVVSHLKETEKLAEHDRQHGKEQAIEAGGFAIPSDVVNAQSAQNAQVPPPVTPGQPMPQGQPMPVNQAPTPGTPPQGAPQGAPIMQ